jgi:hypothetical protein
VFALFRLFGCRRTKQKIKKWSLVGGFPHSWVGGVVADKREVNSLFFGATNSVLDPKNQGNGAIF